MPTSLRFRALDPLPFGTRLSIARFAFENGLLALLVQDHRAPIVSYQAWFKVGSRDEAVGKSGQAHLLEHLLFLDILGWPDGGIDRVVEEAGGNTNAATWVDFTHFYENLPASKLELAIQLESKRMHGLCLSEERLENEKRVVLSERKEQVDDDIEGTTQEVLHAMAFGRRHPYGWPTIGWKKDIIAITPEDCMHFYRTHYCPKRCIVVIVGDFEIETALSEIAKAYSPLAPRGIERLPPPSPPRWRPRRRTIFRPAASPKLMLAWPAPSITSPYHSHLLLVSEVLGGGRSSRLFRSLVEDMEVATDVQTHLLPFEGPSLFEIWVDLRPDSSIEEVLEHIQKELSRLEDRPLSYEELQSARNRLELRFFESLRTRSGIAEEIGFCAAVTGDPAYGFVQIERCRQSTPWEILDTVKRVFRFPPLELCLLPLEARKAHNATRSCP
ncbi:MAG: insulinase family protein [Sandaracinaceae bacterium]|nr:insulinase family protein [Sandaracinaceae bacterium]